jgi:hypothetical protein
MRTETGEPFDGRCASAGAASTMRGAVPRARVDGGDGPDVVVVTGGAVVDDTAWVLTPGPGIGVVAGDDDRTTGAGAAPVVGDGPGAVVAGVLVVVVVDVVVVLDPVVTDVLVARTAPGANVGCPVVTSMSVDPNVQASTQPGGGLSLAAPVWL